MLFKNQAVDGGADLVAQESGNNGLVLGEVRKKDDKLAYCKA